LLDVVGVVDYGIVYDKTSDMGQKERVAPIVIDEIPVK
jgi:hypothetical protein